MRRYREARAAAARRSTSSRRALERRAVIERAKGILMERHGVDEREAFELLRDHARSSNRRVVDVAQSRASTATRCCPRASR